MFKHRSAGHLLDHMVWQLVFSASLTEVDLHGRGTSRAPADYLHCLQGWHCVLAGMLVCVNRQRTRQQLALTPLFLVVGVM